MANLPLLVTKAISVLRMNAPLETLYPLLIRITPECAKLYGKHPGPQIRLRRDDYDDGFSDEWYLWTTMPELDYTHDARWSVKEPLSVADDAELRSHIVAILEAWITEDSLFSKPMTKQDVASALGLVKTSVSSGVKTLNRYIDAGLIRIVELNKNTIRVLKTDLPQD